MHRRARGVHGDGVPRAAVDSLEELCVQAAGYVGHRWGEALVEFLLTKSNPLNNFLDRLTWPPLALDAGFGAVCRDNSRDSLAIARMPVYVKY
jgi:hypothetical protein